MLTPCERAARPSRYRAFRLRANDPPNDWRPETCHVRERSHGELTARANGGVLTAAANGGVLAVHANARANCAC